MGIFVFSLPHRWSTREDTLLELAHFERRRSGRDRRDKIEAAQELADNADWTNGQRITFFCYCTVTEWRCD